MNYHLFRTINDWSGHRVLDSIMTFTAKDLIFLAFLTFALVALRGYRRKGLAALVGSAVTLVLAFGIGLLAAALHSETRPFQSHHVHLLLKHAPGQSFPSDHATASFALALAALVFLSRPVGAALLVVAVLIGFARVYSGIHYPGDILGSLLTAVIAVPFGLAAAAAVRRRPVGQPVAGQGPVGRRTGN